MVDRPAGSDVRRHDEIVALIGLVLGAALYALLVRRRVGERLEHFMMAGALSASNDTALARMRDAPRLRAEALAAPDERPGADVIAQEWRSGRDRRAGGQHGRGRGRRAGGDRRRGSHH